MPGTVYWTSRFSLPAPLPIQQKARNHRHLFIVHLGGRMADPGELHQPRARPALEDLSARYKSILETSVGDVVERGIIDTYTAISLLRAQSHTSDRLVLWQTEAIVELARSAAPSARFAGLRGSAARAHRPSGRRPGGGRSSLHLCHYSTTPKAPLASTLSFCRSPCRNPCKICKNAGKIKNDSYLLNFHLT